MENIENASLNVNSDGEAIETTSNESKDKKHEGKAGILPSVFNLANTSKKLSNHVTKHSKIVLGAGILSFPSAINSTGIIPGIALIFFFGILGIITMRMIFMSAHYFPHKVAGVEELLQRFYSEPKRLAFFVRKFAEFTMFTALSAPCIMFLCIIGDSFSPVLQAYLDKDAFYSQREFIIGSLSCFVVFPLCLLRKLSSLKYTSIVALVSICYVIILVPVTAIMQFSKDGGVNPDAIRDLWINTDKYNGMAPVFFMALPVYAFAFGCQTVAVPIYNELKNPTMLKLDIITWISFLIVGSAYIIVGLFGYLHFGNDTLPDILMNYPGDSITALIGRICIGIVAIFSFPLVQFVQRCSLNSVLFRKQDTDVVSHVVVSSLIFFANMIIALLIPDITLIFGFTVSLGIVIICFVLPAFLCIKLIYVKSKKPKYRWTRFCYGLPIIILLISLFLMITGPMTAFFKMYSQNTQGE